jgi:hypothetical protein
MVVPVDEPGTDRLPREIDLGCVRARRTTKILNGSHRMNAAVSHSHG